ncbi:MAG: hypothetical protein JWM20_125 [Patescibacteria group bacterium]|nr:hypothetical protein [Patescibacteria group bacterium]
MSEEKVPIFSWEEFLKNVRLQAESLAIDIRHDPHLAPYYLFAEFHRRYPQQIEFTKNHSVDCAMIHLFPDLNYSIDGVPQGWLRVSRHGEKSSTLEFFSRGRPGDGIQDSLSISLVAGFFKENAMTHNEKPGKPSLRFQIHDEDAPLNLDDEMLLKHVRIPFRLVNEMMDIFGGLFKK